MIKKKQKILYSLLAMAGSAVLTLYLYQHYNPNANWYNLGHTHTHIEYHQTKETNPNYMEEHNYISSNPSVYSNLLVKKKIIEMQEIVINKLNLFRPEDVHNDSESLVLFLSFLEDLAEGKVNSHSTLIDALNYDEIITINNKKHLALPKINKLTKYIDKLETMHSDDIIDLIEKLQKTFNKINKDLGKEERNFKYLLIKASLQIINAPEVKLPIEIIENENGYHFADEKLNSTNDIQKILIKSGYKNTKRIKKQFKILIDHMAGDY